MILHFVEVTQSIQDGFNHGKFAVGRFEPEEWGRRSELDAALGHDVSLLRRCNWTAEHLWVADLETGEAAFFMPGGSAHADLNRHALHLCPLFEPFLEWLYAWLRGNLMQDLTDLPRLLELPEAPAAMYGYRRPGPAASEKRQSR